MDERIRSADLAKLQTAEETPRERSSAAGPISVGAAIVALFFGGFGAWAAVAPLDGAVVGDGTVVVDGNRRSVDHLDGGVVSALHVREGDYVEVGKVLMTLDDRRLKSQTEIYLQQLAVARATEARLIAERDKAAELSFPAALLDSDKAYARSAMANQREEFAARRLALASAQEVLRYQIEDMRRQIEGKQLRLVALSQQLASIAGERVTLEDMLAKGLGTKARILDLERTEASLRAETAENESSIASAHVNILQKEHQIQQLAIERRSEVARQLVDIQQRILDLIPSLDVAQQALTRTVVTAPSEERVVGLKVFFAGEVIAAGETVLEIVPDQTPLVVSARFRLEDIGELAVGSRAEVHFTSYTQFHVPVVSGRITVVSADRLSDERTGLAYYQAEIALDAADMSRAASIEMYPGMPATVMVTTRPRSALAYLVGPLLAGFDGAFRQN